MDAEELALQLFENNQNQLQVQKQIMEATANFQKQLKSYQEQDAELRSAILHAMQDAGRKEYEDEHIKIVNVKPSERRGVDVNMIKVLHPEVYEKCMKVTKVKGSLRITIKEPTSGV